MRTHLKISQSRIAEAISSKQPKGYVFKPDKSFYDDTGINKHRFFKLWRGEKEPYISEAKAIAKYFNIDITELL